MPVKLRFVRMMKDDLAWEKSDEEVDIWERSLHNAETYRAITSLIVKYRPGIVKFPEEKISYEVATMRYVAANTTIPVPHIYHHGTGAENPTGLGSFIIMGYIEHERTMSDALNDPLLQPGEPHTLNNDISESVLKSLYRQMANIVLQLSMLSFSRIGSLLQDEHGEISVTGRPLIQNMNSLVEFASVPPTWLPSQPYSTSQQWYTAMADMHIMQATFQRNDAILDEDDARDKFVARRLFRRVAMSGRFEVYDPQDENLDTSFRLYSEDLRPSNVLIDEKLRVVGVIDWEFAYAAPAQFSFDPPWWLLLKSPEYWPGGYISWMEAYKPRLDTFLEALEYEEKMLGARRSLPGALLGCPGGVSLSQRMLRRWEDQSWLINYASRNSWVFDFIFWRFIDPSSYGANEDGDHRARLNLLGNEEASMMDDFVKLKMEELKTRALVVPESRDDAAVALISKVMI